MLFRYVKKVLRSSYEIWSRRDENSNYWALLPSGWALMLMNIVYLLSTSNWCQLSPHLLIFFWCNSGDFIPFVALWTLLNSSLLLILPLIEIYDLTWTKLLSSYSSYSSSSSSFILEPKESYYYEGVILIKFSIDLKILLVLYSVNFNALFLILLSFLRLNRIIRVLEMMFRHFEVSWWSFILRIESSRQF